MRNAMTCTLNRHEVHSLRLRAFTLVELLVVLSLITLLMALMLPSLSKTMEISKAVKCESNLRQCGIALLSYANDNSGWVDNGTFWADGLVNRNYLPSWPTVGKAHVAVCESWASRTSTANPPVYGFVSNQTVYGITDDSTADKTNLYSGVVSHSSPILGRTWTIMAANPARWCKLADSLWDPANRNTQWGTLGQSSVYLHLRHSKAANCFFVDGHAAALNASVLLSKDYNWRLYYGDVRVGFPGGVWDAW